MLPGFILGHAGGNIFRIKRDIIFVYMARFW